MIVTNRKIPLRIGIFVSVVFLVAGPSAWSETGIVRYDIQGDGVRLPLRGLSGNAERGGRVIAGRREGNCLICHTVPAIKAPFQGRIGPSLKAVARRLSTAQIRLRVIDMSRLNPVTIMPSYYRTANLYDVAAPYRGKPVLSAQQVEDVIAYLAGLQD